jgi:glycosyltransferase involved in cell wall biosynthesis
MKRKIIRVTTVPQSMNLIKGQISYLKGEFEVELISSSGDIFKDIADRENVKFHIVEMKRSISPIRDLMSIINMYRLLRKEKPYIIHSMTPKAGMVSMIASFFARVPHRIHTFTGLIFPTCTGLKKKILIIVDKITCLCATKIIPEGNGVKRDLLHSNITKKQLAVIGNGNVNGIDTSHFSRDIISSTNLNQLKAKLGIKVDEFVFLSVGRVVRDKGIIELVTAFKRLSSMYPKSKLVILGDFERDLDPIPNEIEQEIINNKAIIYCGYENDVRPYFAISDLFVFPSYREGFPNVVLQAGAMEVPAIVTDINGSNEIIEDGVNGLIIPSKDSNVLFEKMQHLYLNSNELMELKKNCRNIIVKKYEQSFVWKEMLKMYKSL